MDDGDVLYPWCPMNIHPPWNDRLAEPLSRDHLVQLYRDHRVLVEAVALYAGRGLGKGEAVVLVATPDHLQAIEGKLSDQGFDLDGLRQWGQLVTFDAGEMLSRFMIEGKPDAARFHRSMAETIEKARGAGRYRKVRVYGEMVDLLWKDDAGAARRLEELWNAAIEAHSVSLLCGYHLDRDDVEERFPSDLRAPHSRVIPVRAGA